MKYFKNRSHAKFSTWIQTQECNGKQLKIKHCQMADILQLRLRPNPLYLICFDRDKMCKYSSIDLYFTQKIASGMLQAFGFASIKINLTALGRQEFRTLD